MEFNTFLNDARGSSVGHFYFDDQGFLGLLSSFKVERGQAWAKHVCCKQVSPPSLVPYKGTLWGGGVKRGRLVIFEFPLFCSILGFQATRYWEKQHEKCHCHSPFCMPPNDSKN